jgi:hypothetical protein
MYKSLLSLFMFVAMLSFSACRPAEDTYSSETDSDFSYDKEAASWQTMPNGGDDPPVLEEDGSDGVASDEAMPDWDAATEQDEDMYFLDERAEDAEAHSSSAVVAEAVPGCNQTSESESFDLPFESVVFLNVNRGEGMKREAWEVIQAPFQVSPDDQDIPCEVAVRLRRGADTQVLTLESVRRLALEIVRPDDPGHEAALQRVNGVPHGGM